MRFPARLEYEELEMTGIELPAATGAAKLAVAALNSDAPTATVLAELARDHPAMRDAARSLGERTAIKERAKTLLYRPLGYLVGIRGDYFENLFLEEIGEKIDSIPDECQREPSPSLVANAMEGLAYTTDEPSLKELYLNLIASAMDQRREVHSSFASMLRQIDPDEATWLTAALRFSHMPLAEINYQSLDGSHDLGPRNLVPVLEAEDRPSAAHMPLWVDNWVRLGLVEVRFDQSLSRETAYDWVEQRIEYAEARKVAGETSRAVAVQTAAMRRTDLGLAFLVAVAPPNAAHNAVAHRQTSQESWIEHAEN